MRYTLFILLIIVYRVITLPFMLTRTKFKLQSNITQGRMYLRNQLRTLHMVNTRASRRIKILEDNTIQKKQ